MAANGERGGIAGGSFRADETRMSAIVVAIAELGTKANVRRGARGRCGEQAIRIQSVFRQRIEAAADGPDGAEPGARLEDPERFARAVPTGVGRAIAADQHPRRRAIHAGSGTEVAGAAVALEVSAARWRAEAGLPVFLRRSAREVEAPEAFLTRGRALSARRARRQAVLLPRSEFDAFRRVLRCRTGATTRVTARGAETVRRAPGAVSRCDDVALRRETREGCATVVVRAAVRSDEGPRRDRPASVTCVVPACGPCLRAGVRGSTNSARLVGAAPAQQRGRTERACQQPPAEWESGPLSH